MIISLNNTEMNVLSRYGDGMFGSGYLNSIPFNNTKQQRSQILYWTKIAEEIVIAVIAQVVGIPLGS